ncbi:PKD domain-containing protein [Microbacterium lacticum]|nr:PKD domain-containing protein [Microbacterium lacticum]
MARRAFASVVVGATIVASIVLVPSIANAAPAAPADPPLPDTVTADALPTLQLDNGVVWTQTIVGNTVYAAGQFSNVRPAGAAAGQNLTARGNIVAYNLTTGELVTSFSPSFNNRINEVVASPDGTKLYVTGSFTQVNGQNRTRFAVIDLTTGALLPGTVSLNNIGKSVYATSDGVYVGGYFTAVGTAQRMRVAKLNAAGTAVLPFSVPVDNGQVQSIVADPSGTQVVISGNFTTVGGGDNPGYGLYRADGQSGVGLPLGVNSEIRNAGENSGIMALATDGTKFYGVGWHYGAGGNLEGSFAGSWADGSRVWIEDCHGDTYDIAIGGQVAYSASHKHYCGNSGGFPQTDPWSFNHATAWSTDVRGVNTADIYGYPDHPGTPRPQLLNWYPQTTPGTFTGQSQAVWSVAANDKYVVYGGEFPSVNGTRQYGLVRFTVRSQAPNKQGPRLSGTNWDPSVISFSAGAVRLSYQTNWDRDDYSLTYRVYRDSESSAPISESTLGAPFWKPTTQIVKDQGLAPGSTHRYRVTATDPSGNVAKSSWITVVVSSEAASAYVDAVLNDGAANYWRLGEPTGTAVNDWVGSDTLTLSGDYARGAAGAIAGDANASTTFTGGYAGASTAQQAPDTFAVEAWFKTTTPTGGKIVGFGNGTTGQSSTYDRHVYMDDSGRVWFGVYPGGVRTVNSSGSYNDGQWHHVVANLGSGGMSLYIDGKRVGQRADVTSAQSYSGFWRIGEDNLSGWPSSPSTSSFRGDVDDVAVYSSPLSAAQARAHYAAGGGTVVNVTPPSDAYGALVFNSDPEFYWRFDEAGGATAVDSSAQQVSGVFSGDYVRGSAGALPGGVGSALTFRKTTCDWWQLGCTSTNGGSIATSVSYTNPTSYSVETWFKTTSTQGGRLVGFSSNQTGDSSSYDRHVYMQDDGKLVFGTWTEQTNTITTPQAYNDGQWHYVAATQGSDGMRLYVDGVAQGTNPQTAAQDYTGYWRIGGDTTWGSSSSNLIATFDETAVYGRVLTPAEIGAHYGVGKGQALPNQAPVASFEASVADLTVAVDAGASIDSDGTIASYAWDFGDAQIGAGKTASHVYANPGTYTVTLTVTDDDGATATTTRQVEAVAPNAAPTAAFTTSANGLAFAVDGAGSSDGDGTIASYAWTFGDGATATGATASHTYTTGGTYVVTLTVTDDDGATNAATQFVTVTPANVVPVASFVSVVDRLAVSVDGSGSSDPDGTVVSFGWDFGDGVTATGATASHTYGAPGTYAVTLTVTDDRGATATQTSQVAVADTPAPAGPLFADAFGRQLASGWGSADAGGAWTLRTGATRFSVGDGVGKAVLPGASTVNADTPVINSVSTRFSATFSVDKINDAMYVGAITRRVGDDQYMVRVRVAADGSARLHVLRGASTAVGAAVESGVVITPGAKYRLVADTKTVAGVTTISAKIWKDGTAEPAGWQIERSNNAAGLQVAGSAGIYSYVPNAAANVPVTFAFDDITITDPTATPQPPANANPVAAFTPTVNGLGVSVDGAASSDSDGTIASYAWDFGDGATATGATASHTYTTGGTYQVILTVTDNKGATGTKTIPVTVSSTPVDPPANVVPVASFVSVVDRLAVSVDGSGSSDPDGTVVSFGWDFGDGVTATGATASHTYGAPGTYAVTLTVTDDRGATATQTSQVAVADTPAPAGPLFADAFGRQLASGWGSADAGGAWTLRTGATRFSVGDGVGKAVLPGASTVNADTPVINSVSTRFSATFSVDKINDAMYVGAITRRVGDDQYMVRVRVAADGSARLHVLRGASTAVGAAVESGVVITPGAKYRLVADTKTVAGVTTISAKIWKDGTAEPAGWQIERSNNAAGLQVAGSAGIYAYVPNAAANVPVTFAFDDITITDAP